MTLRVTFRLSALGFGGTERVFLSVADYLSTARQCQIDFVVDKISNHETEKIAIDKGYRLIGLDVSRTWKSIGPFSNYLKENRPDIVFSAYTETNAAAIISKALAGLAIPLIVTEHASLDEHWKNKSWMRRTMLEFMVRFIYRRANHVLCVSRGMAEQLVRRRANSSISYIHNPVRFKARRHTRAEAIRELGIEPGQRIILAVGRVCRQKNYMMLLRALEHANIFAAQDIYLYIVGGVYQQDEKTRIAEFIVEHKLENRIRFIEFTHEIQTYYEAADLFVLSSAWEGFGNVLVEALAAGLPIVSTNCNYGPAEILADGKFGNLIAVDDYVAMGQSIHALINHNHFDPAAQIGRAELFSETRAGQAYFELIKKYSGNAA